MGRAPPQISTDRRLASGVARSRRGLLVQLDNAQRAGAISILRDLGFSQAWILDYDGLDEIVFLVPREESGQVGLDESELEHAAVLRLKSVIPHAKVFVGSDVDGIHRTRLF